VITQTTHARLIVCESPEEVTAEIRSWRAGILSDALHRPEALAVAADHPVDSP
jgi:hypothetical protein